MTRIYLIPRINAIAYSLNSLSSRRFLPRAAHLGREECALANNVQGERWLDGKAI